MEDLARFCCLNPQCDSYGLRDDGNIILVGHYGKHHRRLLRCTQCRQRFSERKGTPLFGTRLADDQAVAVLQHLHEGCGVRQTGRLVGVNRKTVARYAQRAGDHAQKLHSELGVVSPLHPGSATRRKVVLRGQEAKALRSR